MKLAVVGAGGVGKSTLISRIVTGAFLDKSMTVGFDVESWTLSTNGEGAIKVCLFDFGGQKQFRFFQGSLMMGAKAALVVFDCTSFKSLLQIGEWMDLIAAIPKEKVLLVGNKTDMGQSIPCEEIQETAEEYGIDVMLVSSKTGENFDPLMERVADMVSDS
jgi:Rab family protein